MSFLQDFFTRLFFPSMSGELCPGSLRRLGLMPCCVARNLVATCNLAYQTFPAAQASAEPIQQAVTLVLEAADCAHPIPWSSFVRTFPAAPTEIVFTALNCGNQVNIVFSVVTLYL